jgi:hypothetical protein
MKKEIEKFWWLCAACTVLLGVVGQTDLDPSHQTTGMFAVAFFGFLFSSLAWLLASYLEYVRALEKKVEQLESKA